jgi:O-antigen/teichoic acid export membrane protein
LNRVSVGKGAAYIYVEVFVASISGYILWLILSKITTPDVIGTSSTVVSFAYILAAIVSLGIPNGLPRHLGKMFSEQKLDDARIFVKASLLLTTIGIVAASATLLVFKDYWFMKSLDFSLVILCILIMGSLSMATLFRYIIISSFRTKLLVSRQLVSSGVRIGLSITLVLMGIGALGLTIAYSLSQILAAVLTAIIVANIFKAFRTTTTISLKESCKSTLEAGIASWIPMSITTLGSQAGTIFVFGVSGSSQAGTYFIAFSLVSALLMIATSLLSAAFPALSAMKDGRKRFSWRIIKISLIISLPISCPLIFYSEDVLGLLGKDYVGGSTILTVLLLSVLPSAVTTGVNTLVYSYGNYRQVLEIGIAVSVPRVMLYFILVPIYGGTGAALSYTLGSIIGFIVSVVIAKNVGLDIFWRDLFFMFSISIGVSIVLFYLQIEFILAIFCTLVISYVLLVKLQIITRPDIQDTVGVLPINISDPAIKTLNRIGKRLSRSY